MPRKRLKIHSHLPKGWRYKNNAYRFRPSPAMRYMVGGKTEVVLGKTLSDAYRRFGELISIFDDPRFMNALIDRYMAEVTPGKSPRTQKDEYVILRQLRDIFGENPVSAITPVHCYQVCNKMTRDHGPTYANRCLEKLSHVFTKGIEWGACSDHPMKGKVMKNKLQPERCYVEDWEIKEALKVASPLIEGYVDLKMMTGLRMSDMLSLRWSDVKDDGIHVQPRKTAHSSGKRLVIIWDEHGVLMAVLGSIKALRRPTGSIYLFCNRSGQSYI